MGIPGLASFVNNLFSAWKREVVKGLLVLDGNNVCYKIYEKNRISWSQGGQYGEFRAATLNFIDCLLAGDISPIFVFDGIDYKNLEKVVTKLDHHEQAFLSIRHYLNGSRGNTGILSVMTKEVFRDVLEERRIPFFYVDGEGDPDIAALANSYGCPVVSDDSDFYIFNLTHGCITMDRLHWESSPVHADVYYRDNFCKTFKLDPDLCFAIPAIVGNDFIAASLLTSNNPLKSKIFAGHRPLDQSSSDLVEFVIQYLANYNSLQAFLHNVEQLPEGGDRCSRRVKSNYEKAEKFYTFRHNISETSLFSSTELKYYDGTSLPFWILEMYRLGKFGLTQLMQSLVFKRCLLQVVPDDPSRETAQYCSRPIRQAIYGILDIPEVVELVRKGSRIDKEKVESVYFADDDELPGIRSIRSLTNEERKVYFCNILEYGSVENVVTEWQLVVAVTYYWAKKAKPSVDQIKALILTFVKRLNGHYTCSTIMKNDLPVLESFHLYAQWQCVYKDSAMLNNVLMTPLQYVSPAFLFDGKLVMYYAHCHNLDDKIQEVSPEEMLLYKHLGSAILTKLRINQELNLI